MKLSKFLLATCLITFFTLLYVYQQTEIFRLAYVGQKKITYFEDLLDKNSSLRYNIGKSASLTRIGDKLSKASDFEMPDTFRLVRLIQPSQNLKLSKRLKNKENIFSLIFGIKREAQAKTVNP